MAPQIAALEGDAAIEREMKFPSFPYKPYSIQIDFMTALYQSLDRGGIAMLESPTGTGKTLSIICSAFQWLADQTKKPKTEVGSHKDQKSGDSDDEPDWLKNFAVEKAGRVPEIGTKMKIKKKIGAGSNKFNRILCRSEEERVFDGVKSSDNLKTEDKNGYGVEMNDEVFLVDEYESEEEGGGLGNGRSKRKGGGFCSTSSSDDDNDDDDDNGEGDRLKIYFCSRTHSQLSQFVQELKKTEFANELNVVSLGSRKNFCINDEVLKLRITPQINERCLELQKNTKSGVSKIKSVDAGGKIRRTKALSGCPMLRKHKTQKAFRDEIYQQGALDIEDLVHLGRQMGTCPYYGSRSMVPTADLVVLPYQSLLSKTSRESLGLNLKNNIIIIDEAHNLADSLISMYDAKITLSQLEHVHSQIEGYFQRFRNQLGPSNRRYIQTLMVLTQAFLDVVLNKEQTGYRDPQRNPGRTPGADSSSDSSMAINDFLFSINIDNINLVKLVKYIKESNIMHKVSGYGDKMSSLQKDVVVNNGEDSNEGGSILSNFQALVDMLFSLTNNDGDGRIIISRLRSACSGQQGGYIKYIMLSGEKMFSEIASQAQAIILAGGTLQPIEETRERLFPWLSLDQIGFFSCSHIVPPESILPLAISRGPSGLVFDFSYSCRSSTSVIKELGLLICNLVTVIPEGIVVFFSSFDYEGQVYNVWKELGILERIKKKKRIFREPRRNTEVELVLKEYKETINSLSRGDSAYPALSNGAILLAVVGGKISEGINFSDGMGRCIIMVGLPYPSPSDIELMERVKHIEFQGDASLRKPQLNDERYKGDVQSGFDILRSCKRRGKEYYENLCMKAVNQSIGRAIRHINDYAAILLVDARYATDPSRRSSSHPTNKLPQWIKSRVSTADKYGEVHMKLHQFFKLNRTEHVR